MSDARLSEFSRRMDGALEALRKEFGGLRTDIFLAWCSESLNPRSPGQAAPIGPARACGTVRFVGKRAKRSKLAKLSSPRSSASGTCLFVSLERFARFGSKRYQPRGSAVPKRHDAEGYSSHKQSTRYE